MARMKLNSEQRATLLEWIAADYDWRLIRDWFNERGWPMISRAAVSYYRTSRFEGIEHIRTERYTKALDTGLALKAERVMRLKKHADELEAIKWTPDKNGWLRNERAWRETLADIADEMGHRKQVVEITDWRTEAIREGYDADKLYTDMVAAARARVVEKSNGGSVETGAIGNDSESTA